MTGAWLWLFGPPGVGKTATGFRLFQGLAERGERVAFVEIDQIGISMPSSDTDRSATKADNLLGVLGNFAAVGAAVVVTGDIVEGMPDVLGRAPSEPVLCRLRVDDEVAIERLRERGGLEYAMPAGVYESLEVPAGDLDITTHGSIDAVVDEILRGVGSWPPAARGERIHAQGTPERIDGLDVVLISGPRPVGTSTVAWRVLMDSISNGHRTGFLDLGQLAFLAGVSREERLVAELANTAVCSAGFRRRGVERLVLCGHAGDDEVRALRELFLSLHIGALSATADTLLDRARQRSRHRELSLPGEDLYGQSDDYLRNFVLDAQGLVPEGAGLIVETDALPPADIAAEIGRLWPR